MGIRKVFFLPDAFPVTVSFVWFVPAVSAEGAASNIYQRCGGRMSAQLLHGKGSVTGSAFY
jgi:hypothetical protein